jgi:hypothetical protein
VTARVFRAPPQLRHIRASSRAHARIMIESKRPKSIRT